MDVKYIKVGEILKTKFLGKFAISHIAIALSVCLYLYVLVCVWVTFVTTGHILAKIRNVTVDV